MRQKNGADAREIARIVLMKEDYTTASGDLGERTYRSGHHYQVCDFMHDELVGCGVAEAVNPFFAPPSSVPERPVVRIIPSVTRWISANGRDTHQLVEGQPVEVPSNLAAYLIACGAAA